MKKQISNELKLLLFSALIGAAAGIVFWLFLFVVNRGTWVLWEMIPERYCRFSFYPLAVCTVGGFVIGLFRKMNGDYPEDMMTVLGKMKKDGTYPYQKMPVLLIAALLPLIIGSSVGPEAGMVGIVVALCCWAGDNLRFAGQKSRYFSKVGAAVTLSVMFRSPLFGILDVEEGIEGEEDDGSGNGNAKGLKKSTKIMIYCIAVGAGFGCFAVLSRYIFKVSEGFPTFEKIAVSSADCILYVVYIFAGLVLGLFFEWMEKLFEKAHAGLPAVAGETLAGAVLGAVATFLPVIRFSGEEQMGILITDFWKYAPLAMIGIAFLKILMTTMCIKLGLKGGHFFPLIFAAVCLGYGISLLIFPGNETHAVFAAAVVTAATLGVTMKKPLAASLLLLICFPANALLWIVPAAALASFAGKLIGEN